LKCDLRGSGECRSCEWNAEVVRCDGLKMLVQQCNANAILDEEQNNPSKESGPSLYTSMSILSVRLEASFSLANIEFHAVHEHLHFPR
jgi:hypothetical protein